MNRNRSASRATGPVRSAARRPLWRRLLRFLLLATVIWIGATWLCVLLMRFVPPLTSAFMIERRLSAALHGERDFTLRYEWTPRARVSASLPIALVAEMRANLNLTVAAVSTVFAAVTILIVFFLDRTVGLDRVVGQGLYRG